MPVPDNGAPDRCKVCGQDGLGVTHGFFEWWCKRCILQAQIDYATKQAARIPTLRAELAKLDADHG